MHRFLAILLILLIPVRVFGAEMVGLCMMQMSASHAAAATSMPDDCPDLQKHQKHQKHDGSACDSCQLCMPLAGPDEIAVAAVLAPQAVAPIASIAHFASAEVQRALRPPIS